MKIALDYDNTITADPIFWSEFIKLSKKYGHSIKIVTIRNKSDENSDIEGFGLDNDIGIIYSNMKQKNEIHEADIWIDDMPLTIPSIDSMNSLVTLSRI